VAIEDSVSTALNAHLSHIRQSALTWRGGLKAAIGRIRYQLLGGFLVAIVAPAVVHYILNPGIAESFQYRNSLIASCASLMLGFLVIRKLSAFPGVRATAYIAPTFLAAFGLTVVLVFFLRINYSGAQLAWSFVLATAFFYVVLEAARGGRKPLMDILLVGEGARLLPLRSVAWRVVQSADQSGPTRPLVVDLGATLDPEWERFIAERTLSGQPVYDARKVFESLSGRVQIKHISENAFGSLMPNSIYTTAKRQVDLLTALVAFVLLLPSMLVVALFIRLESPGPAIFRQKRVGMGGRPFTMFKFRTMRQAASVTDVKSSMTVDNDPRVTPLGKLLRRLRIDELPQILNIVLGEMSWIGPRPEAVPLAQHYEQRLPFYVYRHVVRPGLTGWAQVHQGHVTSVKDVDHKLQYDFFYIKHFSMWLDLLVALKTVRVVLTGSGAR
jgi:lipopolysaccharide/colanic/teichoic acid biosynthesis glycosyltransferase